MDCDFQSLNKGVFVVPFKTTRPSRIQRPLKRYYDEAFARYQKAYDDYEMDRMTDQMEDITNWLKQCAAPAWVEVGGGIYRVPSGIMQNAAPALEARLDASLVARYVLTLNGTDVGDVNGGMRSMALGLVSQGILNKRSGKTGLDQIEEWYSSLRSSDQGPILIHITSAQLVPHPVLPELLYILSLHPSLPIHILLSVPSIAVFLDSLSFIEPTSVDMSILGEERVKSGGSVRAIVKANEAVENGIRMSKDVCEALLEKEDLFGAGPLAALKTIKWALLHHSVNSPLATLAKHDNDRAIDIVEGRSKEHDALLEVGLSADMVATLDPSPRTSILYALSNPSSFTAPVAQRIAHLEAHPETFTAPTPARRRGKLVIDSIELEDSSPRRKKRKAADGSATNDHSSHAVAPNNSADISNTDQSPRAAVSIPIPKPTGPMAERGDLRELQTMFNLYKGAGRNINLWDWFGGFKAGMMPVSTSTRGGAISAGGDIQNAAGKNEGEGDNEEDDETSARLHAAFVRFCEEARMIGLMRARGNARRKGVDEVVKSIGLL